MCMLLIVSQVGVGKGSHPGQVKVFGPGVERSGLKADQPTHFTVDCSGAGEGNTHTHHITPHTHTHTHIVAMTPTLSI
jgi:hypothetical protein